MRVIQIHERVHLQYIVLEEKIVCKKGEGENYTWKYVVFGLRRL